MQAAGFVEFLLNVCGVKPGNYIWCMGNRWRQANIDRVDIELAHPRMWSGGFRNVWIDCDSLLIKRFILVCLNFIADYASVSSHPAYEWFVSFIELVCMKTFFVGRNEEVRPWSGVDVRYINLVGYRWIWMSVIWESKRLEKHFSFTVTLKDRQSSLLVVIMLIFCRESVKRYV